VVYFINDGLNLPGEQVSEIIHHHTENNMCSTINLRWDVQTFSLNIQYKNVIFDRSMAVVIFFF